MAADKFRHFFLRGPDIGQVNGLAVRIDPERVAGQVDVDVSGQGIGDDKRW